MKIGAHVEQTDPIAEAKARNAPLVQFFLGDPQGYKGPVFRYAGGAEGLKADAEAAGVDLYVHAPYLINVATTNNRHPHPRPQAAPAARRRRRVDRREGADRARRSRQQRRRPGEGIRQLAQGGRGDRPQAPAADREHRRRRQRDDPLPRADRRGLGRDLGAEGSTWSASASTPATPTPAATRSRRSSTTSSRSPAGSTWCTATTAATSSTPAPTGTPTSAPARSTPTCWPRWSATPAPRWSGDPGRRGRAHRRLRLAVRAALDLARQPAAGSSAGRQASAGRRPLSSGELHGRPTKLLHAAASTPCRGQQPSRRRGRVRPSRSRGTVSGRGDAGLESCTAVADGTAAARRPRGPSPARGGAARTAAGRCRRRAEDQEQEHVAALAQRRRRCAGHGPRHATGSGRVRGRNFSSRLVPGATSRRARAGAG